MAAFPSNALAIGAARRSATSASTSPAPNTPRPARMQIFLPFARISAACPSCASGDGYVARHGHGDMVGHVSGGARVGLERERLDVDGHSDVGDPATAHGGAAG